MEGIAGAGSVLGEGVCDRDERETVLLAAPLRPREGSSLS